MTDDPNRSRFRNLLVEAEGFLELRMFDHALRLLAKVSPDVVDDDEKTLVQRMKGDVLRGAGRHSEAVEIFEELLKQNPEDVYCLLALAWSQKRMNRIDLAAESMRQALLAEPENPLLHYNLSCYCALLGDRDNAVGSVRQALELDPEYRELIPDETDFDSIRNDPRFVDAIGS